MPDQKGGDAALQVIFELPAHEHWKVAAKAFNFLNEPTVMLRDNGIKCRLFRPVPLIGQSIYRRGRSEHQP